MEIETAWCSSCKKYLPVCNFRKNSRRKNGLSSSCRDCERIRENSESGKYKSYRRNARQRGIEFAITKEYFIKLIESRCVYCGDYGNPFNGVDRVDNNKGYAIGNCVPCCEWCNKIKMNHTRKEMIDHIVKMFIYGVSISSIPGNPSKRGFPHGSDT